MPATILLAHPSTELYGSDRVAVETALGLQEAGHRVVVALPGTGPLTDHLHHLAVETVVVPSPVLRKEFASPRGAVRLLAEVVRSWRPGRTALARLGVDVLVVNTVTIPFWPVLARLRRHRVPVVCHVHEAEASAPRAVRQALALPLRLADRVVANSRFSREVVAGVAPRVAARTVVIANAVPGPPQQVPARPDLTGGVRLLFVGRLSPRKGPDVAVAAAAALVAAGVDVRLDLLGAVFPGYEWFEADLRAAVEEHGLTDRVRLLGFDDDVWPHLAAADIALVPSTVDEPFGNTAVEAVLAARPAVVSATSGLLEAAAGYAAVVQVPPGDPEALAGAVRRIVADWPRFRDAARADAEVAARRHGTAAYRRAMTAVVEDVLGARP